MKKSLIAAAVAGIIAIVLAIPPIVEHVQYKNEAARIEEHVSVVAEMGEKIEKASTEEEVEAIVEEFASSEDIYTADEETSEAEEIKETPLYEKISGRLYANYLVNSADTIGWIEIEGSSINYPVMQDADDNEYYLHHDITGIESNHGSIYLDSRQSFSDSLAVIYGHHMADGTMFKDVSKYVNKTWASEHDTMSIETIDGENRTYRFLSAYEDVADGTYRGTYSGSSLVEFAASKGITVSEEDEVIVLITCGYNENNGRIYTWFVREQ